MPHDFGVRLILGGLATLVVVGAASLALLLAVRPRGVNLREARHLVPDVVRLLRSLHGDRELPAGVRRWLRALLVYLAVPVDLVPDFVPVLGYADDAIVVALVFRRVARLAGPAALERHWLGSPAGRAAVRRLAGLRDGG